MKIVTIWRILMFYSICSLVASYDPLRPDEGAIEEVSREVEQSLHLLQTTHTRSHAAHVEGDDPLPEREIRRSSQASGILWLPDQMPEPPHLPEHEGQAIMPDPPTQPLYSGSYGENSEYSDGYYGDNDRRSELPHWSEDEGGVIEHPYSTQIYASDSDGESSSCSEGYLEAQSRFMDSFVYARYAPKSRSSHNPNQEMTESSTTSQPVEKVESSISSHPGESVEPSPTAHPVDMVESSANSHQDQERGPSASPSTVVGPPVTEVHDEESACPICLDEFGYNEKIARLPHCKHYYHDNCLFRWLLHSTQGACALCRLPSNDRNEHGF